MEELIAKLFGLDQPENMEQQMMQQGNGTWAGRSDSSADARQKQIRQFTYGQGLPDSPYRPTALTKYQNQPFKSMMSTLLSKHIRMPSDVAGKQLSAFPLPYKIRNTDRHDLPYDTIGDATMSIGKDEKGHYLSVFDSWDFLNGDGSESSKYMTLNPSGWDFLQKHGKPFNIYDRFYFDPVDDKQGAFFPYRVDVPFVKPGDIELPPERPKPLDRVKGKR